MSKTLTNEKATSHEERLAQIREVVAAVKTRDNPHSHLITVLHKTQELYGYLPTEVMDEIAQAMEIPASRRFTTTSS